MQDTEAIRTVEPAGTVAAPRYEFNLAQNEVMATLGQAMRGAGRFLGVIGILSVVIGLGRLFVHAGTWQGSLVIALASLLQGGIFLFVAVWTRAAGDHFAGVANTTGADIQHLMEALREVRQVYGLARVVLAAALVLLVLAMILTFTPTAV